MNTESAVMRDLSTSLLMLALNHNAAVMELSAMLITAGDLKPQKRRDVFKEFRRIHDDYDAKAKEALKSASERLA